jgi:hypothetical protein
MLVEPVLILVFRFTTRFFPQVIFLYTMTDSLVLFSYTRLFPLLPIPDSFNQSLPVEDY